MELLGYFLGGFGVASGLWAIYHSRVIIRLKREGYIEYAVKPPPVSEPFMLRED